MKNQQAIIHFNNKVLLTSQGYLDVKAYEHALAFTVAKMLDKDLLKDTHDLIAKSLENGTDFREFKKQLLPLLFKKGWLGFDDSLTDKKAINEQNHQINRRLRTIYHTNLHTAYSAGQWQRIEQTKEFLPYLQYMPSVSENKRLSHTKLYNIVRPVDDPIWQSIFPPNGYGCKCWCKQITKTKAEKIGISKPVDLDMETVENPRTGEKMTTPVGVHFSFNHNHDRLTALLKLAEDKHGTEFGERLKAELTENMLNYAVATGAMSVANFGSVVARQAEIDRLKMELDGTEKLSEGVVGDEWQQYHNVLLERYDPKKHKVKVVGQPADFATVADDIAPAEWLTIDFMMTVDDNKAKIGMNAMLEHPKKGKKAWDNLRINIQKHLEKSDVVPIDLRHLNAQNAVKLIAYVLSLSREQQSQIVLIKD